MSERITQESDPDRWQALLNLWKSEHRPGFVVTNNTTYRVLQLVGSQIVFEPIRGEALYESTSGI